MKKFSLGLCLALVLVLFTIVTQAQDEPPAVINFTGTAGLLPEGVEWDANRGVFLVGSQGEGLIQTVADDGTLTPLIEDDDLIFSNGIHIDHARNRLLVTTTDVEPILDCDALRQEQPFTGVAVYDLATLERLALYDLSGVYPNFGSMTNDVTVDDEGNIYATDWCGSGVAMIDTEGNISSVVTGESFYVSAPGFGAGAFNGIDWHPDGYLLVSGGYGTTLYKIAVNPPTPPLPSESLSITPVSVDAVGFADGVTILPNGDVVIIGVIVDADSEAGFSNATVRYTSDDDFATATLTGVVTYERFATTGVVRDGAFYSVFAGIGEPLTVADYEIVRMDFDVNNEADASEAEDIAASQIDVIGMLFPNNAQRFTVSTYIEALEITGIDAFIAEQEIVTVFAPTNAAFRNLAEELGVSVEDLLADTETLREILLYHIFVGQRLTGEDLSVIQNTTLAMANGQLVTGRLIEVNGVVENARLTDSQGREAVVSGGTTFDNSIVYTMNVVMLPTVE